ncbi:hypothetical protein [Geobacter grbiciae]|uniref:hypothetical protein n=1 Tax=Geobacter grbiciae TaxID=155042 RepID=UPI001C024286|nr:hypothetical protein [Geobacter grbiciae]MBT1075309.1 hypothetical protein [Geobacter grbiciae]
MNRSLSALFATLATVGLVLAGCSPAQYVLVQSSAVETMKENAPDVTATPRYYKMISQIQSVALNAPSSCADKSAAATTGSAEGKGEVVKTRCGVEMAEIERALVRQGFTVYSWNMLNQAIAVNTNATATEVAKKLGAQLLFQVNSLERVKLSPDRDARLERNFYESNEYGDMLKPLKLEEGQIKEIKEEIGSKELKQLLSATKLGAMLDISAIDSETGQTIWFYRWSNQEDASKSVFASFLMKCHGQDCNQEEVESRDDDDKEKSSEKRSKEVETYMISGRPASEQDAIYFSLLRNITADFVKRFSSGK